SEIQGGAFAKRISEVIQEIEALMSEPDSEGKFNAETFYTTGLALIDAENCPFCDNHWDAIKLRTHVQSKIDRLRALSLRRKSIEQKIGPLTGTLAGLKTVFESVFRYAVRTNPPVKMEVAKNFSANCQLSGKQLTN